MRDIKTKQKMQAIKTKDTKRNIQHFSIYVYNCLDRFWLHSLLRESLHRSGGVKCRITWQSST